MATEKADVVIVGVGACLAIIPRGTHHDCSQARPAVNNRVGDAELFEQCRPIERQPRMAPAMVLHGNAVGLVLVHLHQVIIARQEHVRPKDDPTRELRPRCHADDTGGISFRGDQSGDFRAVRAVAKPVDRYAVGRLRRKIVVWRAGNTVGQFHVIHFHAAVSHRDDHALACRVGPCGPHVHIHACTRPITIPMLQWPLKREQAVAWQVGVRPVQIRWPAHHGVTSGHARQRCQAMRFPRSRPSVRRLQDKDVGGDDARYCQRVASD